MQISKNFNSNSSSYTLVDSFQMDEIKLPKDSEQIDSYLNKLFDEEVKQIQNIQKNIKQLKQTIRQSQNQTSMNRNIRLKVQQKQQKFINPITFFEKQIKKNSKRLRKQQQDLQISIKNNYQHIQTPEIHENQYQHQDLESILEPKQANDLDELSEIFQIDEYNSRHNSFLSLDSIDRDQKENENDFLFKSHKKYNKDNLSQLFFEQQLDVSNQFSFLASNDQKCERILQEKKKENLDLLREIFQNKNMQKEENPSYFKLEELSCQNNLQPSFEIKQEYNEQNYNQNDSTYQSYLNSTNVNF